MGWSNGQFFFIPLYIEPDWYVWLGDRTTAYYLWFFTLSALSKSSDSPLIVPKNIWSSVSWNKTVSRIWTHVHKKNEILVFNCAITEVLRLS